jgi:hypothetical protein
VPIDYSKYKGVLVDELRAKVKPADATVYRLGQMQFQLWNEKRPRNNGGFFSRTN